MPANMTVPCDNGLINLRVGAIILKDGKFLMAGNARDAYLYSVGGRIRFGETAEEAVIRETQEETGWRLAVDRLGFVHENYFYGDIPGVNRGKLIYEVSFYFYMKVPADFEPIGESATDEGRVRETMQWVTPDDPRTIYPEFYRTELRRPEMTVKHFVTDERGGGA
ncbi:MAG: NUDIX domain-containing protein [Clostridia bacterium]|nr:NUDIX domain-containing protein [Clostridia bacterium]